MKGIGEKLKEAREEMGVSIDEVSEDLKVKPSDIEEVEKGNIKALKDIFSSEQSIISEAPEFLTIFSFLLSGRFISTGI